LGGLYEEARQIPPERPNQDTRQKEAHAGKEEASMTLCFCEIYEECPECRGTKRDMSMLLDDEATLLRGILAQTWEDLIVARNAGWDQEQLQDIIDSLGVALSGYPSKRDDLVAAAMAVGEESGSKEGSR
jgi:hypothetical protein